MKLAHRRFAPTFFLLGLALFQCFAHRAQAEVSYFPIPAVSTTRNDGNDAGFIVPFLVTKPDGDLQYIVAPMFIVNSIVGARGSLNVFRYDPGGRELRFIASYTEEIERRVDFRYTDPAFLNGRFAYSLGASFFKNATARFFGLTQRSTESDETNYTAREGRAFWKFGVYLNEVTQIAIGQRFREVEIQRGATALPFSVQQFPTVDGMQGATLLGHRAIFHYDTRDNLVTPTDGTLVTAYGELVQNLKKADQPFYQRYVLDFTKLVPSESKRMILVVRGNLQTTFGSQVPFFERSSLGGENNLRGYGVDRFIDDHLMAFSVEQRINVLRTRILNVVAEFEVAPFLDMGKVFNTFQRNQFKDVVFTPGVGFRGIIRPSVVGRVDWGYSNEGGAVFAGLDFPF